jgi:hypothetical protein
MKITAALDAYAEEERGKFDGRWINLFAFSVSHAATFSRYLDLVLERYLTVSSEYAAESRRNWDAISAGESPSWAYARGFELQIRVHLEIESFYLLAKILLDRLAMHVEYIFGAARGSSLGSHHKLIDDLLAYVKDRGLSTPPPALLEKARQLREKISDYRDDEIAHATNPRVTSGTSISGDGRVTINRGMLYPTDRDQIRERESLTPVELGALLDGYVSELVAYLRSNIHHAKGCVPDVAAGAPRGT